MPQRSQARKSASGQKHELEISGLWAVEHVVERRVAADAVRLAVLGRAGDAAEQTVAW